MQVTFNQRFERLGFIHSKDLLSDFLVLRRSADVAKTTALPASNFATN
jgi:hypothetical protein